MTSPEGQRTYKKHDVDDFDGKSDKFRDDDDDDWEGDNKRKYRSSKSRRSDITEESEGLDSSGRKRSAVDRSESRKRSGDSGRVDTDEDEYDARKESRSKSMRKKPEENTLERLSNWYQDGEPDTKYNNGDRSGGGGHIRGDESDRRTSVSKFSDSDSSQLRNKGADERRENSKGQGSSEHRRNSRRRWDEPDSVNKADESDYVENNETRSGKMADHVIEGQRNSSEDKDVKSQNREERRTEYERGKRGRFEAPDEDNKGNASAREEDSAWTRERRRETDNANRSRTPERSGKRYYDTENNDMEYERSTPSRKKEQDRDGYKDDRSKGRDDSWSDRSRDRDGPREGWKRRQGNFSDKEMKEGDSSYDHGRDWELPRRGWMDNERPRSGVRKDGNRTEAVKTTSKFGISTENYDVIEINTRNSDYGRDDAKPMFPRRNEVGQYSDARLPQDDDKYAVSSDEKGRNAYGSGQASEDLKDALGDGCSASLNTNSRRDDIEYQGERSRGQSGDFTNQGSGGQTSSGGSQPPHGNQEPSSFNRAAPQNARGVRLGRTVRGRSTGRDNHQVGLQMPMVGSPFGPLGMPPPLNSSMSPAPVPPISPGVFIPPFSPPIVWPGARGVEMNMLGVPPGPSGLRFPPSIGNTPNPGMYYNQPGPGRGAPPSLSGPNFNSGMPAGRVQTPDKTPGGWVPPPRTNAPPGKAPSRGEQNDYSQNFVDTGMRPQNFIRELELTSVVEDYPKLRELIQKKDEIVAKAASAPMYYKCDLHEQELSPEFFGTKFDVILIDPPWEEYVHRAPGVTDNMEYWTFEEIMNLKIEAVADTPSFIFLWVGDGVGLEQGRQCLKKWGFRRCEDICWVKTNKNTATPGLRHDSHTLFQRSKEHCLMGIKGTVRRSTDGHIIHANIDTDVIIAEEPPYGSTAKPEDMYRIIEHFALGRRRLELFGEDHNIRSGWLTVGKGLTSSNFNAEAYVRNFADKDGKVWQGGGGRNPPPDAPHLVVTTPDIESLRPKSPMKNQQQQQQQSASISLTTANSSNNNNNNINNRRATGNSPQNHNPLNMTQEASSSNIPNQGPWAASPMEGFKGRENGLMTDDRILDMYGYNGPPPFGQVNPEFMDFESHRAMNM